MEKEIFPIIIKDTDRFFGYKFEGYWMDIGRISSYIDIHKFLIQKNKINYFEGQNCEIKGILQESCIGNNVHIGKNAILESTIVYDNTIISENTKLSYCVIGENCKIGRSSDLKRTVVGDNEKLKVKSIIDNKTVWTQKIPEGYPNKQIGNPIEI
jgi:NDP-sugar pyrophosphorylase family protein